MFNGEIGFYDASWRSSFGGNLYLTAGSTTGSVALPTAVAQALYDNVDDGTPVIIYYSEAYEVSEDTLTVTQAPEADDENVDDTTNTTTVPCRCTSAPTVPYWKPSALLLLWMPSTAPGFMVNCGLPVLLPAD